MDPKYIITVDSAEDLVMEMVNYLHNIQTTAQACVQEAHQTYYNGLVELLQQKQQLEENKEDTNDDDVIMDETEDKEKKSHPLYTVKLKYEQWMTQIPMIGFNSGKYDINMVKPHLVKVLMKIDAIKFVVKKSNSFMCLQTERLNFVDIRNYLAPGFDYATYLKAYKCSVMKGFFPDEWMNNLDKLNAETLPRHADFFSTLKKRILQWRTMLTVKRYGKKNI